VSRERTAPGEGHCYSLHDSVLRPLGYVNAHNRPGRLDLQGDISLDTVLVSVMQTPWGCIRSIEEVIHQKSAPFILC
jgi:hypothetical protein